MGAELAPPALVADAVRLADPLSGNTVLNGIPVAVRPARPGPR